MALEEVARERARTSLVPPHWVIHEASRTSKSVLRLSLASARACGAISDVQVTNRSGGFTFLSETFVAGEFSGHADFKGFLSKSARRRGIYFEVSWLDNNGDR